MPFFVVLSPPLGYEASFGIWAGRGRPLPSNLLAMYAASGIQYKKAVYRRGRMIRRCGSGDLEAIWTIINKAAQAYRGVIPDDCWHEPYMPMEELAEEIAAGVVFWGWEREGRLVGVMGLQDKGEVALVRHAYVHPAHQRQGIGSALVAHLRGLTEKPMLVGTWAAASWAIRFYEKQGFSLVPSREKDRLLRRYWSIPERQIETSVVLADATWWARYRLRRRGNS